MSRALRLEAVEELLPLRLQHLARPGRGHAGVAVELLEVDRPAHGEVVVAREADVGPLGDRRAALVRSCSVADEVAEAPELVRRLLVDRREDRLQRVQVRVDVGDDCDAHRQRRTLTRRGQAPSPRPPRCVRRRSPQRPAAIPVTAAAPSFRRPKTTTPSSAGASRSSQPMSAEPKIACCRLGSGAAGGDGARDVLERGGRVLHARRSPDEHDVERGEADEADPDRPGRRGHRDGRRGRETGERDQCGARGVLHEPAREPGHQPQAQRPPAARTTTGGCRGRIRRSRRAPASRTSRAAQASAAPVVRR